MDEVKVESEITGDYCSAYDKGKGIQIIGGWLEKNKALEFADKLVEALLKG